MENLFNGNVEELISSVEKIPVINSLLEMVKEKCVKDIFYKMRNGCPVLTSKYNALPCPVIDVVSPTYQLANEGLFIDVATYLNGEPECWISENYSINNKPAKDFYINISCPETVSKETIFSKLIQIVKVIDSLEGNGQRLNVFLAYYTVSNRKNENKADFICKIKDQSEPVNIHQLIYLVASSAVQRYCAFTFRFNRYGEDKAIVNYADMDKVQLRNEDIFYCPSYSFDIEHNLTDYANTDLRTAYKII
ncbi:hypothetical protein [Mucilaginibacter sp.]|uniref:DUF7192 family protein n=1 Tax=Mucilaginibacter sp. TaxID=1882438 RepID=UPI00374C9F48